MDATLMSHQKSFTVSVCGKVDPNTGDDCFDVDMPRAMVEVAIERHHQDDKWGGASHDDHHRLSDWNILLADYGQQGLNALYDARPNDWRHRMVQIAALAVAAVESFDRKANASADFVESNPAALESVRKKFAQKLAAQDPDHPWLTGDGSFAEYLAETEVKGPPPVPGVPEMKGL